MSHTSSIVGNSASCRASSLSETTLDIVERQLRSRHITGSPSGSEIVKLAQTFQRFVHEPIEVRSGVTLCITHIAVLEVIGSRGPVSIGLIARRLDYTTGAMTRIIDALEARGLVGRLRVDRDRRVVSVNLTPLGTEALAVWAEAGTVAFAEEIERLKLRR